MSLNRRRNWFDHTLDWLEGHCIGGVFALIITTVLIIGGYNLVLAYFE